MEQIVLMELNRIKEEIKNCKDLFIRNLLIKQYNDLAKSCLMFKGY
ncbi:MAG: hypothetical protein J6Z11_09990 [Candidatus Riflebacteria bacterium]|nr:hypothetical protein [Candidatus Riflebacteria bacterium]